MYVLDSPRELISQLKMQGSIHVGSDWQHNTYPAHGTELKYSYRVVCKDSYFGSECNKACIPRDDSNGHFTCNQDGSIQCKPGWEGPDTYCITRKYNTVIITNIIW